MTSVSMSEPLGRAGGFSFPCPFLRRTLIHFLCHPARPQSFPDVSNRTAALLSMPKGRYQHLKRLLPLLANQSEDCLTLNIYVPGSVPGSGINERGRRIAH
uniref:Uncharacterized protein n=1 Tax=Anopheles dirus TaxID=7168 RepID=A0A182N2T9_9DIPT